MILPPKNILCMAWHVAAFSVDDKTTLASLFLFMVGMGGLGAVWFSGSIAKGAHRSSEKSEVKTRSAPGALFPAKFIRLLNALIADVLFLQRLLRLSPARWIIHVLIFF